MCRQTHAGSRSVGAQRFGGRVSRPISGGVRGCMLGLSAAALLRGVAEQLHLLRELRAEREPKPVAYRYTKVPNPR